MKQLGLVDIKKCEILIDIDPSIPAMLGVSMLQKMVIFRGEHFNSIKNKCLRNQLEIPFPALSWAIDTIEIGFGKSPDEGGLPRDVLHAETVIDDEEIYLRRTMNCGAPYQQGYTLKSFSRSSYINPRSHQSVQLPDYLLFDEGLLEKLKLIASGI